jgi:predicted nuclease of predicted toxin-antitoxin system
MIRFLVDAQLPPGLASKLVEHGYPAEHVNRVGLGVASDGAIWAYARQTEATLITKDEDFTSLARRDPTGPAVIWIRLGNITNESLWRTLGPLLDEVVGSVIAGERIVEVT